jgi:mevalonate kinase
MKIDEYIYSPGKLLLTGEYALLEGARGCSIPLKYGQYMKVKYNTNPDTIKWTTTNHLGHNLHTLTLNKNEMRFFQTNNIINNLSNILFELNIAKYHGIEIDTYINHPIEWGIGSSSSLISNLIKTFELNIDDFYLHLKEHNPFTGSGSDIYTSYLNEPIIFRNIHDTITTNTFSLSSHFRDHVYFIYSNKKVSSSSTIKKYYTSNNKFNFQNIIEINYLTNEFASSKNLEDLEKCIQAHEDLISFHIKEDPIQKSFPKYWGKIKSLGSWGGDFFMATSNQGYIQTKKYFEDQGHNVFYKFCDLTNNMDLCYAN